jgi:hypothetical protein
LFWDPEPSESSVDILSGENDFEGYKIYRSEDQGLSWGQEIHDQNGNLAGYVPLAQFDLVDSIEGVDPAFPYQSLGEETGLKHTYIDTTIYNGIEYWYCVAAYDQGNQDLDSLEPSYENPKGRPTSPNVVAATPASHPQGYTQPYVVGGDTLRPVRGLSDGLVLVNILDPSALQPNTYRLTFQLDSVFHVPESVWVDTVTFTLFDVTSQETLLDQHEISDSSFDNIPVVHGFRLTILNSGSGTKFMGWTKVNGDTCGFQWWRWVGEYSSMVSEPYLYGISDFRIVVDYDANVPFTVEDGFGNDHLTFPMPIRVYDITDTSNAVEVSQYCRLLDYSFYDVFSPQVESLYFGPEGWDLVPGGAGYNPAPVGQVVGFYDQIGCWNGDENTATGVVYFGTQNGPDTLAPPSDGDEYTILTSKPLSDTVEYEFTVTPPSIDPDSISLTKVGVVPNPYIMHSKFESTPYDRRLMFTNLPERCEIMIYNVAGEHINTIEHNNDLGYDYWDLRTKFGVEVAYGMYVFVVRTEQGTKAKGKFVIIK